MISVKKTGINSKQIDGITGVETGISIKNCINISESDLNINTNIYKTHQIEPESLTEVSCDMITQKSHLIRYVFKLI